MKGEGKDVDEGSKSAGGKKERKVSDRRKDFKAEGRVEYWCRWDTVIKVKDMRKSYYDGGGCVGQQERKDRTEEKGWEGGKVWCWE